MLKCKKKFSAIFTSADRSFLAYPTGISMNPTWARKCRLTRASARRLSFMMSGRGLWRFDACFYVMLTSFSAKLFIISILDRNRTKHFLTYSNLNAVVEGRVCKKNVHNGCLVRIENPVTQDSCSASLGKPRDAEQLPSWQPLKIHIIKKMCNVRTFVTGEYEILCYIRKCNMA